MSLPTLFVATVATVASLLTTMTACAVVDDQAPKVSAPPEKAEVNEAIRVEIGEATLTIFDDQGHAKRVVE